MADGVIGSATLVWRQGMTDWLPYAQVMSPKADAVSAAGATNTDTEVCSVSGKRYPKREMIQFQGKWIGADHRDEFFQRQREGLSAIGSVSYAGFWIRFLAKFIDGIILYVINMPFSVMLGFGFMKGPELDPNNPDFGAFFGSMALLQIIGIAIGVTYVWFFLSRYEATPGKMALGLKIVRADGSKLTTGRIIGRYFGEMVSGLTLMIGYIIAAFDEPEKRSLHDRICDTRVIKK